MEIKNKFVLGDCLDVLKQVPDSIFDLIILDPPYNLRKLENNDNLSREDFLDFTQKWIKLVIPKLKEIGTLYCFSSDKYVIEFANLFNKYLTFRKLCVWHYNASFLPGNKRNYSHRCEYILFYTKSDNYTFNQIKEPPSQWGIARFGKYADKEGNVPYDKLPPSFKKRYKPENYKKNPRNILRGSTIGNVFDIPRVVGSNPETKFGKHPTQKPEELISTFIKVSSNEGDLVGDFFAGSGTILVCAKKLRRKYFGIEMKQDYYDITMKRLKDVSTYKQLF